MSASIRPLPVQATPQRTESDAKNPSAQPDEAPGFGEVLNLHLDSKKEEPEGQKEPPKKPAQSDASPWTVFGIDIVVPPPLLPLPEGKSAVESQCERFGPRITGHETASADKNIQPASEESTAAPPDSTDLLKVLKSLSPPPVQQKMPPDPPQKVEEIAGNASEPAENSHGIPVAKHATMLLSEYISSLSHEQHRAVTESETLASEQAPIIVRPFIKESERPLEIPAEKITAQHDTFSAALRLDSPTAPAETERVTEVRAASIIDSIRDHVQILRVSQQNDLHVILRPDAHTELSLQIRQVDGQVHLQARCERGDFTWLDSQWNAVQNTLSHQGIRVEPLQAADRTQDSTSSMLMHDQRGSQEREQRSSSTVNFAFEQENLITRKPSSIPATSGSRMRGWQSWA